MEPGGVLEAGRRVAHWQVDRLDNPPQYGPSRGWANNKTGWVWGAYFAGLTTFARQTHDAELLDAMRSVGRSNEWQLGGRPRHADDWVVGWSYAELHLQDERPAMLAPMRERFDTVMRQPWDEPLEWGDRIEDRELAWCDALFMGPPTLARLYTATGDKSYLDFADKLWWKTTDYLYDQDEHLYFRDSRYFDQTEPNGEKVFWARGNGWVFAGLARMLEDIPAGHPSRGRYETLFKEMAAKLLSLQGGDGFWPTGLLDPQRWDKPESSGTAFFTYGLAWGVNHGLLDAAAYRPAVEKGWGALVGATTADGKLERTQPIGADPYDFDPESTMPYGVGGFLLAASEVYTMALLDGAPSATFEAANDTGLTRLNETVELDWSAAAAEVRGLTPANVVVVDRQSGVVLLSQAVDTDADGTPDQLLIQTHFTPGQTKALRIHAVDSEPPTPASRVFGRAVPERLDDYAWESDRIAYRVYGPALAPANDAGSGIDPWVKSVRYPILDKWYAGEDYHTDHGEGLDNYKVGKSRGAGGLGVFVDDKLYNSGHYTDARHLANGPVRVLFELDYAAWDTPLGRVTETKRISLDRGRNLSRIESVFTLDGDGDALPIAIGLVRRDGGGESRDGAGWIGYWEPVAGQHGNTGVGAVLPGADFDVLAHTQTDTTGVGNNARGETNTHTLVLTHATPGEPFVYYAGAGWSKSGDFPDADAWFAHLAEAAERLEHPVTIRVAR